MLPEDYNIGDTVHEYGGGAFAFDSSRKEVVFSNRPDAGVYSLKPGTGEVRQVVKHEGQRFADFDVSPKGWVAAVRETHDLENDLPSKVVNELVAISVDPRNVTTLATGQDFYSTPRFSSDGRHFCWLQWNHPEMPWTGSKLYCADFDESSGRVTNVLHIAGSGKSEGISQPRWGPSGSSLYYATDTNGYWQLYHLEIGSGKHATPVVKGLEDTDHAGAEFLVGR